MAKYWVCIMASRARGTLYIGMTADLRRRAREHRSGRGSGFTRRYGLCNLVWYQVFNTSEEAEQRERTMKEWPRAWKINLIERINPEWVDLWPALAREMATREAGNGVQAGTSERCSVATTGAVETWTSGTPACAGAGKSRGCGRSSRR